MQRRWWPFIRTKEYSGIDWQVSAHTNTPYSSERGQSDVVINSSRCKSKCTGNEESNVECPSVGHLLDLARSARRRINVLATPYVRSNAPKCRTDQETNVLSQLKPWPFVTELCYGRAENQTSDDLLECVNRCLVYSNSTCILYSQATGCLCSTIRNGISVAQIRNLQAKKLTRTTRNPSRRTRTTTVTKSVDQASRRITELT